MKKSTVLITGSSRGIGRRMAELFAANDYNVMINYYKSEDEAMELLRELREKNYSVAACKADISNPLEVEHLLTKTIDNFSNVDVLINNAGIAQEKLFTDILFSEWQEIIQVNLSGTFLTSQAALRYMLAQKSGKIINIASIWGMVGASCEVAYSASKAGIIGLTKALAKELAPSGITVNCIAPGAIETEMLGSISPEDIAYFVEDTPLKRLGSVDDVANVALFLASAKADFFTGQVLSPNGGVVI